MAVSAGDVTHVRPAERQLDGPGGLGSWPVKALILAGGAGTRLRPITHTRAKQLVPVANKPILFYGLEAIADAGIKEVGIVVGDTAAEVRAAVGDGSAWGLTVTYLPQAAPLGLAHAVLIARDFLGRRRLRHVPGRQPAQAEPQGLRRPLRGRPGPGHGARRSTDSRRPCPCAQILLKAVPDPHRFGVAELDARRVGGPPAREAGRAAVRPGPGRGVPLRRPGPRGGGSHPARRRGASSRSPTPSSGWSTKGCRVRTEILDGWWIDTGKLTPLLEANRLILETLERRIDGEVDDESEIDGRVVVEAGARVVRSRIRGPVVDRRRHHHHRQVRRPFSAIGRRCVIERQRDRALGDPRRLPGARRRPPRGLAARPSRRGDPDATGGPEPPGSWWATTARSTCSSAVDHPMRFEDARSAGAQVTLAP